MTDEERLAHREGLLKLFKPTGRNPFKTEETTMNGEYMLVRVEDDKAYPCYLDAEQRGDLQLLIEQLGPIKVLKPVKYPPSLFEWLRRGKKWNDDREDETEA